MCKLYVINLGYLQILSDGRVVGSEDVLRKAELACTAEQAGDQYLTIHVGIIACGSPDVPARTQDKGRIKGRHFFI